jgi:Ca2+-binding EF-hand superfamily protein
MMKLRESIRKILREELNESVKRITEDQQGSIKIELLNMVKDMGWRLSAKVINGSEKLAKLAFNNDPMEFLHMFDDMDIVQSELNQYWTLFRYKEKYNLMVYKEGIKEINVSYKDIWSFLTMGFDLKDSEIKEIINIWLDEVYNIRGVEPFELLEFKSGNNQMKHII